jgi:hypothetical protein
VPSPIPQPARLFSIAALACAALVAASRADIRAEPPPLAAMLERYDRAMVDPGAPPAHYEIRGGIAGGGSWGDFHTRIDGDRSREDDTLGPGLQQQFDLGDRAYEVDFNGIVRELRGLLLRRLRTERLMAAGALASLKGCCTLRGESAIDGKPMAEVVVQAAGGEPETMFVDEQTGLPRRITYEDQDGTTTVDLSDWHSLAGRRFAFRRVESNGDHRYDMRQTTETIETAGTFGPGTFRVPATKVIESDGVQSVDLDVSGGTVTIPVEIAKQRYTFLLDSGSQDIVLDRALAKKLGLYEQGDFQILGSARTGGLRFAALPELSVGSAHLTKLIVDTFDLRSSSGGALRVDGILGYPFFAESLAELDLAGRKLRFARPGAFAVAGERIPLELDRSLPEAAVRIKDVWGNVLIDTGNSGDLLLFRRFVDRNPGIVPSSFSTGSSMGLGGAMSTFRSTLATLRIGSFALNDVGTDVILSSSGAFADLFMAGDVGYGVLKQFIITFDFTNDAIYFRRNAAYGSSAGAILARLRPQQ